MNNLICYITAMQNKLVVLCDSPPPPPPIPGLQVPVQLPALRNIYDFYYDCPKR